MPNAINVLDAAGAIVSVATNDAVKASVDAGNALLTTQAGYLDGIEGLITATNAAVTATNTLLSTQATYLDGIEGLISLTNTALAGTLGVNQVTAARASTAVVTRPANTTAYPAGAVVGGPLTLASMAPAGGAAVMITNSRFEMDITALPSGAANFRLYLYSATPPSALADGLAWDLPAGDRTSFLGYVDLGTPVDLGSTLYVQQDALSHQCLATGTALFAYLVTIAGYTPGSAEVYKVTLQDVTV